jgi:hypothetical protein
MASDLAAFMVPIGYAGAAIAVVCAVLAAFAIMRGAGGLTGGAVGVWIVGALLSVAASFGNQWMPLIVACASLAAMLVIGGVVRAIVTAAGGTRAERTDVDALPTPVAASRPATAPVAKPVRPATSAATASIPVVS